MESVDYYARNEEILYDDETWDDRHLVEAYDKSVDGIKKKIARKMGLVNGTDEHDDEKEVNKQKVSKKGHSNWRAGDFCRANYSVDGLEYEAKIVEILSDGQCVVKYCGYDNEEIIKLKHLKQSLGKQCRVTQKRNAAKIENSDASDISFENVGGVHNVEPLPEWSPIPGVPAIPPPPPLNVMPLSGSPESESDALSTMLMSWYMTGYHTGYYQGLMQAKKQFQKPPKK